MSIPDNPEDDQQWWNEIVHIPLDLQPLLNGIRDGTSICVTDGLYKHTYGAAALIVLPYLEAPEGVILVNQTPGLHSDVDAYQAELGSIYGCLAYIEALTTLHNITTGQITLACNCWSAILNVFIHTRDTPSQPQFDLVHSCRLMLQTSNVQWASRHVTAHQDDHVSYDELDRWGQLNVDMDSLAKRHRAHIEDERRPTFGLPSTLDWSIWRAIIVLRPGPIRTHYD
jgi:hypothetical protein